MNRFTFLGTVSAGVAASTGPAFAQASFPTRPISIVVPFAAGGAADISARLLAQPLQKSWGQTVLIRNLVGSGGIVGERQAATAAPDGYTLFLATNSLVDAPWTVSGVTVKPDDFTYLGQINSTPNYLVVRADSPLKSVADVVAQAKKTPGQLAIGSTASWGSQDIARARFERAAGVKFKVIEGFANGPAMLNGLLAGTLDISFNNVSESLPHIEGGKVRALACTGAVRSPFNPDVKTFRELGFDVVVTVWRALAAPAAVPKPTLAVLASGLEKALTDPALITDFKKAGQTVDYLDPQATEKFVMHEYEQEGNLFKQLGIAVQK